MSDNTNIPNEGSEKPDIFSRLSITMCPQDDGTRPVNPAWIGSQISFLSPAIKFSSFPLPAGQPTSVDILINNFGTADACGILLETAYNMYMGNQPSKMVGIQNKTIPLIPAGSPVKAQVVWTPPNVAIAHACFHARVSDSFSLMNYPARCKSWNPYINPQAGSHNVIILKIQHPQKAAVITYPLINTSSIDINPKLLVSIVDDRNRFFGMDNPYPLPFSDRYITKENMEPGFNYEFETNHHFSDGIIETNEDFRTEYYERQRFEIDESLIHNRFGFDMDNVIELPHEDDFIERDTFFTRQPVDGIEISSFTQIQLHPNEERLVKLVIPPSEFPPYGRRKKFQIDYQEGDERPVQNFLYLYH